MKAAKFRGWLKRLVARGGIIVFFIMAFEVMIMISPFAFFYYSVFSPIFHWLDAYPVTQWLTHFFLPHMILPPTLPLKIIRISGSVLFVLGCTTFTICALQVYLGKIFKRGIANRGIYRFVRHPQYSSLGIWGVGMAILWPRFIVLGTLSIMFILYYFLAKEEERRMVAEYGDSYRQYMRETGMFFPSIRRSKSTFTAPVVLSYRKIILVQLFVAAMVIGTGFVCRFLTLHSLQVKSKNNIALVSIMPEDSEKELEILNAIQYRHMKFLNNDKEYLGYVMPVDYIMQGMIANTGGESHLYKQHHTVGLIIDWVIHPFEHLRRSPSARMAKMRHVDPKMARRHHCPLGINNQNLDCNNCEYRRVVFVEVDNPANSHMTEKELFAFNTRRIPVGFIDIDTKTGDVRNIKRVDSKTAWSDVPTPAI
ncbi:MAG: isoprenylcysteine carboxylmethyltransferase family protein [Desulfobacterales bacterium]